MRDLVFWRDDGVPVPAVTAVQMREVDRIAVEEFGLGILQMMENAGRNLARIVQEISRSLQETATLDDNGQVFHPGQRSWLRRQENEREGIPVDPGLWAILEEAAGA